MSARPTALEPVPVGAHRRGTEVRDDRIYGGLTARQYRYCEARARGERPFDAYQVAYGEKDIQPGSITRRATELESDSRIVAMTKQLITGQPQQSNLVPRIVINRDMVAQGIASIATNPNTKDQTRLRAYELLGKMAGIDLFRDIHVTEKVTRTVEDIDRELKERLASLAPMIDAAPTPRADDAAAPADRRRKPKA